MDLLGLHLGFVHVIKSPGLVEKLTILGFHVGFIQVIESPGPMEEFAFFLLGFPLGFI